MHVTRVELKNIKSYDEAEFNFERGTTAIVGPNGAGKTTILEAIAWALFDTLDYSKDDFLRRGQKKGAVRVSFESDADGRAYTVYRDTGNGYYVHDTGLNARVAEKKQDVGAKLRQLLGVEPGTDVQALFRSAIGVPQGTLTADFLKSPAQRKASFDKLLKVEEYREGAERLRDTVKLIEGRALDVHKRIANAEGQLSSYDRLVSELEAATRRASELADTLEALRREVNEREAAAAKLDEAERRANESRARAERLQVEREAAERRLRETESELAAATRAGERQAATAAATAAHLAAQVTLQKMEAKRGERDRLRVGAERVERMIVSAEADVRRLTDALDAAKRAQESLAGLESRTATQSELERERDRARELRARAVAAREQLRKLDDELSQLRKQHTRTKEFLHKAESAGWARAAVERLEGERRQAEIDLSKAEQARTARKHLTSQRADLAREVTRLRAAVATLEQKAAELERGARGAERLAELEAGERDLAEQAANLRAEIARDEKTRAEVRGGVCPILRDRCESFSAGQTYDEHFKNLIEANRARLSTVQAAGASVKKSVAAAREARVALVQFERERAQLAHERGLLGERERLLTQLDEKLAAIKIDDESLDGLQSRLTGIDGELIPARDALQLSAQLEPLREQLAEIEARGKKKREDREQQAAEAGAVENLDREIADTEARLRELGDPRGQAAALRETAEGAASLQTQAEDARGVLRELGRERESFTSSLAHFADFDVFWTAASAERDRTAAAFREHTESKSLADTLPARREAAERAAAALESKAGETERARREHETAAAGYDAARHAEERASLAVAGARVAEVAARLEVARDSREKLAADIARLEEVSAGLQTELREQKRLGRLTDVTEFMRDTLKKAGPEVTKSYVAHISVEANGLYREITGEAGRTLRWTSDYEIVLEEGGHDRSFVNLSGGEQVAAALAVRLALLKQLSDIRLAFFDEPTVNMDAERRERLAQQIGQVRHFDQLFVISHDDTFEETVDHVVVLARREEAAAAVQG